MRHMWRQSIWLFIILILVFVPEQFLAQENTETPTIPPTATLSPTETATIEATLAPEIIPEVTDLPIEPEVTTEVTEISEATVELTAEVTVDIVPSPAETEDLLAPQPEPELTAIVSDGFVTESNPNWTLGTGWQLIPLDGNFALQGTGTTETASYNAQIFADVAVEAVLQSQTVTANLIIRQSETGHYRLSLSPDGQVVIYRDETVLASTTVVASTPEQWRHIRFSVMGYTLRAAIDGVEVLVTTDAQPLPAGTVAFTGTGNSSTEEILLVDNVRIWIPVEQFSQPTPMPTEVTTPEVTAIAESNIDSSIALNQVSSNDLTSDYGYYDHTTFREMALLQWQIDPILELVQYNNQLWTQLSDSQNEVTIAYDNLFDVAVELEFVMQDGNLSIDTRRSANGSYRLDIDANGNISILRSGLVVATTQVTNLVGNIHVVKFVVDGPQVLVDLDGVGILSYEDSQPLPSGIVVVGYNNISNILLDYVTISVDTLELAAISSAMPSSLPLASAFSDDIGISPMNEPGNLNLNNNIVYSRNWQIYMLDLANCILDCDEIQITDTVPSQKAVHPQWSPDRTRLVFYFEGYLYMIDTPDGVLVPTSNFVKVSDARILGDNDISWSPDGSYIAATIGNGISIINLDNCNEPQGTLCGASDFAGNHPNVFSITHAGATDFDENPTWSPDGSQIAFVSSYNHDPGYPSNPFSADDLYIVNIAYNGLGNPTQSGTPQLITTTGRELINAYPDWSPDGSYIALTSIFDFFIIRVYDFGLKDFFDGPLGTQATWSPDGDQIAYVLSINGYNPIWGIDTADLLAGTIDGNMYTLGTSRAGTYIGQDWGWESTPPPPTETPTPSQTPTPIPVLPETALTCKGITTATPSLIIRDNPSTSGGSLGNLNSGTEVEVLEVREAGAWYKISVEIDEQLIFGFVSTQYVTLDQDCESARIPIVQEDEEDTSVLYQDRPPLVDSNLDADCSVALTEEIVIHESPSTSSTIILTSPVSPVVYLGARTDLDSGETWYYVNYVMTYSDNSTPLITDDDIWQFYIYPGWVNGTELDFSESSGCGDLPLFDVNDEGRVIVDVTLNKSITVDGSHPDIGSSVTFTSTIINNSTFTVDLIATEIIPSGYTSIIINGVSGATYTSTIDNNNVTTVIWSISDLGSGASIDLKVDAIIALPPREQLILENGLPDGVNSLQFLDNNFYTSSTRVGWGDNQLFVGASSSILESEVFAQPGICLIYTPYRIAQYRAPIRGNQPSPLGIPTSNSLIPDHPSIFYQGSPIAADKPMLIDTYAVDPINNSVKWIHVIPSDDTIIDPGYQNVINKLNNWTEVNSNRSFLDQQAIPAFVSISPDVESGCFDRLEQLTYFETQMPNISYDLPTFDTFPVDFTSICSGGLGAIWGIGVSNNPFPPSITYPDPGYHNGSDFFIPVGSNVYSIGNGIVVGIGDHRVRDSQRSWGSTTERLPGNEDDAIPAFSIIVRYGSLYVLYGHIRYLEAELYVGAPVVTGQILGSIGQYETPHLHLEVRNGNSNSDRDGIFELDSTGNPNSYGILGFRPNQIGNAYDFSQFYEPAGVFDPFSQNTADGMGLSLSINTLILDLESSGSADAYQAPLSLGTVCNRPVFIHNDVLNLILPAGSQYRSFILFRPTLELAPAP